MQAGKAGCVDRRALGGGNVGCVMYGRAESRVMVIGASGEMWLEMLGKLVVLSRITRWHRYHLVIACECEK